MTSAIVIGVFTVVCVLAGTITGVSLRKVVQHHLTADSKEALKMGAGLIATLCAMVLGLLVSSAKNSFDNTTNAITQSSVKMIMLDGVLAHYGPETEPMRELLCNSTVNVIKRLWPEDMVIVDKIITYKKTSNKGELVSDKVQNNLPVPQSEAVQVKNDIAEKSKKVGAGNFTKAPATMEIVADELRELVPQSDSQRAFQSQAMQIADELLQTRWLMIEQAHVSMPATFIVVLLLWLTFLFGIIGLLAAPNKTVLAVLFLCAISVGGAIFLIEEMNKPFGGIVKVSDAPLIKVVEQLNR